MQLSDSNSIPKHFFNCLRFVMTSLSKPLTSWIVLIHFWLKHVFCVLIITDLFFIYVPCHYNMSRNYYLTIFQFFGSSMMLCFVKIWSLWQNYNSKQVTFWNHSILIVFWASHINWGYTSLSLIIIQYLQKVWVVWFATDLLNNLPTIFVSTTMYWNI